MAAVLLSHLIDRAADTWPEKEAIRFSGQSLTYGQLVYRANGLSGVLKDQGVRRGDRVGIFMNKCLESAVAIYAVMKAGGAYVPLDPFAPASRLRFALRDCGIRHLITADSRLERSHLLDEETGVEVLVGPSRTYPGLRSLSWEEVASAGSAAPSGQAGATEQDLAYILYTSGSTGTPKGIMHTHGSGLSFARWAARTYGLTERDRLSNHAPLHFDLSTFDYFAGASVAATTVIIPEGITKFPASISRLIQDERLTIWYSVPFALIQMLQVGALRERNLESLRWVLFAGEVFPTKHLRRLREALPFARLSNLYGPTETNVCTYYDVNSLPDSDEPIPIGKPCSNVETLILDESDNPVDHGEAGELVVRGDVVMRGYWGRPDLDARSFFSPSEGLGREDAFYRTGDLVRMMGDGNLRYIGRKDRQIKVRGYRIELDEIEAALLSFPSVEEAAAFSVADEDGNPSINAVVTGKNGATLTREELLPYLRDRLSPYAVPQEIRVMPALPRGSTGKIDRRELAVRMRDA